MQATSTFTIDRWDETEVMDQPGSRLVRTVVAKTFRGQIQGTGLAELIMAHAEGARAYAGYERIEATVGDRRGAFVLIHDAVADADGPRASWTVLAGSGTGALAGITGTGVIHQEGGGHTFVLDYTLP